MLNLRLRTPLRRMQMQLYSFTPALVVAIFFFHFLGDFILQSHWMATNKARKLIPLSLHIIVYTLTMCLPFGWKFALLNGLLHFCVDFCTSKVTSALWAAKKVRMFFIVIGLDQFAHALCLVLTAHLAMYPKLMC